MSSAKRTRVILVDNHPIVRSGIRAELEKLSWVEVVGEADDGRSGLEMVAAERPDAVFMDISMPGLNGLDATQRLSKEFPNVRVIIVSRHENEQYFWHALKAGASGYLLKRAAIAEMGAALEKVLRGEIYLSREVAARLRKKMPLEHLAEATGPLERLTTRQREILQLIAEGQTTKGIGLILKVSPKTVEYHRARLMRRLNIHDIPGLVRLALSTGLIAQES